MSSSFAAFALSSVLIETYWNVNFFEYWYSLNDCEVLIETYWNVNFVFPILDNGVFSINRNILECKCVTHLRSITSSISINRNILECKYSYFSTYKSDLEY